jgi:predicted anti-sigma-YlaC factor YlaD
MYTTHSQAKLRTEPEPRPVHLSCEAVEKLLADYLLRELSDHERTRVETHLRICDSCRRLSIATRHVLGMIAAEGGEAAKLD